jgi:hypothetical protein
LFFFISSVCSFVHLMSLDLGLLLCFLLLLDLGFSVHSLLPSCKLLLNVVIFRHWPVEPRMSFDFFQRESMSGVILEHEVNQVLELLTKEWLAWFIFILTVTLPEDVSPIEVNFAVERVLLRVSSVEGRVTSNHDEKDNCSCKQVNLSTIIGNFLENFRSHVTKSS